MRTPLLVTIVLGITLSSGSSQARYPDRPITIVVPFAAGGPTDVIARIVSDQMTRTLGQPVVIDNVTGEAGTTAVMNVVRSAPDGYTLLMGHMGTHGAAPALANVQYDPVGDFTPIGLAADTPIVIVTRKNLPAADLASLAAHARANPETFRVAHAGEGSVSHTSARLLSSVLHISPKLVLYRGTGPAMNDLAAGRVDMMTDQIVNVAPHLQKGSIKAFAIATLKRSPVFPEVPTTQEAGLVSYQVSAWAALFGPKDIEPAIAKVLSNALVETLDDDITRKRLLDLGAVIPARSERSPEALVDLVRREVERWRRDLN